MISAELTRWPWNRTPAFLMIDDIGDMRVGEGREGDWGFSGPGLDSTWEFFNETYRRAVPSLRIVAFACVGRFLNAPETAGLRVQRGGKIGELLRIIGKERYAELGFHGIDHTAANGRPECAGVPDLGEWLARGRTLLEEMAETRVIGGKCPGYEGYERVAESLKPAGFRWWADAWTPVRGRRRNIHGGREIIASSSGVRLFPANIGAYTGLYKKRVSITEKIAMPMKRSRLLARARFLVEKGIPVSIQTHYAALRPDGTRQVYNLYDDRPLLLPLLVGLDGLVWWALPREICDYLDTMDCLSFRVDGFKIIIDCDNPLWEVSFRVHPCPSFLRAPDGYRVYPKVGLFTFLPRPGEYEAVF